MKTIMHSLTSFLLAMLLLSASAYSQDRVDGLMFEDSYIMLEALLNRKDEIKKQRSELNAIENSLRKTKKGQSIYLKFETITGSLIAVGIIIGSYKAYFPPGFRAMAGAYVTVTGISHGLIKLSSADVQKLLLDITKLSNVLSKSEMATRKEILFHCGQIEGNHQVCYQ